MLQIELLLRTLTKPEVDLVKKINVKGKQRQVLLALINGREDHQRVRAEDIGISPEHFHQILSVLLQKCYAVLAGDDLLQVATVLTSKNLTKLLYQQLKLLEVRLKDAPRTQREEFYRVAFETSQWVTYDDLNLPLVRHFGKRYIEFKSHPQPGDHLFVEIRMLRNTIAEVYGAGIPGAEQKKRLRLKLDSHRRKVYAVHNEAARYQLHCALCEYYILVARDPLAARTHLQIAEQYVQAIAEPLQNEERSFLAAEHADIDLMLGNYQQAYDRYKRIWNTPQMTLFVRRSFYHTIRFAEVATITGDRTRAVAILDGHIDRGRENLFLCSKLMRYIVIALLDGDVEKARKLIDDTFKYNSGKSYAYFTDVRTRFLQVACAYIGGDWQLASSLITRALQFIRRKKVRIINSDFGYYFKFIAAAIRLQETGKPIPKNVEERVKRTGHFRFFALVLDQISAGVKTLKTTLLLGVFGI